MEISLFLKGFVTGVIIALPIGPVAALIIQRTLNHGRATGIVSGAAAAVGDTLFAALAAFALTFISGMLTEYEHWFKITGGAFLVAYGLKVFFSKPSQYGASGQNKNHYGTFGSALLLTLSNPLVILSIVAVYAILGIVNPGSDYSNVIFLLTGVFAGGLSMWVVLCNIFAGLRHKMGQREMSFVNRITGFFIMACGTYAVLSLF